MNLYLEARALQMHDDTLPCPECGKPVRLPPGQRSFFDKRQLCTNCDFWDDYVRQKDNLRSIRINGALYWNKGSTAGPKHTRGFDGARFVIQRLDPPHDTIRTVDLASVGSIPERWQPALPDNAIWIVGLDTLVAPRDTALVVCTHRTLPDQHAKVYDITTRSGSPLANQFRSIRPMENSLVEYSRWLWNTIQEQRDEPVCEMMRAIYKDWWRVRAYHEQGEPAPPVVLLSDYSKGVCHGTIIHRLCIAGFHRLPRR